MSENIIKHQIQCIQDHGIDLTDWEKDFIRSIILQHKAGRELSEKQCAIVERIYTNRTPTGSRFGYEEGKKTTRVREEGRE